MKKKIVYEDEIDFLDFVFTLWKNKIKFLFIITLSILLVFGHHLIQSNTLKNMSGEKELELKIYPISKYEELKYNSYNYYIQENLTYNIINSTKLNEKIFDDFKIKNNVRNILIQIDKKFLYELFIDNLRNYEFIKSAIRNSNLLKKETYESNEAYEDKIRELAESITVTQNPNDNNININELFYAEFKIQSAVDIDLYSLSKFIFESGNKSIQDYIAKSFKDYNLYQEESLKYLMEKVDSQIINAIETFNQKTANRLAFLKEQAAIARKINLEKPSFFLNNMQLKPSPNESGVSINSINDIPYFLRGYQAIEMEIDLIQNRSNQSNFNDQLINLNSMKNELIILAKNNKKKFQSMILSTPVFNSDDFIAAQFVIEEIKQNSISSNSNLLALKISVAVIIGSILSIFYIYISIAIQKRNRVKL